MLRMEDRCCHVETAVADNIKTAKFITLISARNSAVHYLSSFITHLHVVDKVCISVETYLCCLWSRLWPSADYYYCLLQYVGKTAVMAMQATPTDWVWGYCNSHCKHECLVSSQFQSFNMTGCVTMCAWLRACPRTPNKNSQHRIQQPIIYQHSWPYRLQFPVFDKNQVVDNNIYHLQEHMLVSMNTQWVWSQLCSRLAGQNVQYSSGTGSQYAVPRWWMLVSWEWCVRELGCVKCG